MGWRIVSTLTSGRISGVDIFVMHLTEELRRRGHDARILLTRAGKEEVDAMPLPTSAPVDSLPPAWRRKRRHRRHALREYLISLGECIYMPNYDFCHSPISARLPATVRTVGILHSDDAMHYDHVRQLGRFWNRIVTVSQRIAETCRAIDVPADKLLTIPYGIPVPSEPRSVGREPRDPIQVIYVGRLEQTQKRVLDMVAIMDRLADRGIPFRMTMVGEGPMRSAIEAQASPHMAAGRLTLAGTIPNDQMASQYQNSDIFLLTSAFEGLPVSLLEAMGHGCVPIITRVESGVSEVVQSGTNGELVAVGDIDAFVEVIARLQQNPDQQREMARKAHRTLAAGGFSLPRMVDRYEELFEEMMHESSSGRYERPAPYLGELWLREWQFRFERNWGRLTGRKRYPPQRPKS
jgi:glycosyltransferase involved in cell wall biosynthesis